jgi:hypothetical protein
MVGQHVNLMSATQDNHPWSNIHITPYDYSRILIARYKRIVTNECIMAD